jgi:hypothetical protein
MKDLSIDIAGAVSPDTAPTVIAGVYSLVSRARVFPPRALLELLLLSVIAAHSAPPDTVIAHELRDISGSELVGSTRTAGEAKLFGTFVLAQVARVYDTTGGQEGRRLEKTYEVGAVWPREPVPFILRLTFEHGGAFRLERRGRESLIELREFELRWRDGKEAPRSRKFSRAGKRGGYVYEVEFLREDMQAIYKMELWGRVNEQEAKSASGGVYRETILLEVEGKR